MTNDNNTQVAELIGFIKDFSDRRGWSDNENAQNLIMALNVEAAELLEIFQWIHSDAANGIMSDAKTAEHVREEIADVAWYLLRICSLLGVDLSVAIAEKAVKNAVKYPEPEHRA